MSIPKAERFSAIKPKIKELNEAKQAVWVQLKVVRNEVQGHEGEIEKIRKALEKAREGQTDVRELADAVTVDVEKIEEVLTGLFAAKDE